MNKLQACNAVRDAVANGGWRSRKACLTKVVVACNWVAFIATNEVLSYCSLCQLWIQANFGCSCCSFSSFSLRPSIDVAPDGHVGRWTSSPLLHAVEAPGTFLWHFLGTSGIYVNADQITKWSKMIRARTSASSSAMHEGVFSRLWWKSSVSGARGHRRLCHFSCSVKVNFNRHNLVKLKKKESYYFHKPTVRRRLGWQPVNDHRSVCAKRWLLVREDVAKCAANLIAICTVVLRQTWQYGVNRRCGASPPPPFFCSLPPTPSQSQNGWPLNFQTAAEFDVFQQIAFPFSYATHTHQRHILKADLIPSFTLRVCSLFLPTTLPRANPAFTFVKGMATVSWWFFPFPGRTKYDEKSIENRMMMWAQKRVDGWAIGWLEFWTSKARS